MRHALVFTAAILAAVPALSQALAPEISPRPVLRMSSKGPVTVTAARSNIAFENWISGFRKRALAQGIRPQVFDAAFQGVRYDDEIINRDRNQTEFTKQIWEYLEIAASDSRINNGREALRENSRLLASIEAHYGVEAEVVAAVWGLESAYGTRRGDTPVIEALATLAFDGRRGRFFEQQLIAALQIIQAGDVHPRSMTGSWAGAMGHTQFIPTSYLAYAQDFRGDGKRDIWSDDPTDALASTAAYLARFGWTRGQPWGVEVALPRGFDYSQSGETIRKSPADWAALGVRDMRGQAVPNYGPAAILLPAGARGAAFMIFDNFKVIKRYNASDAYAIGVGHLADRIGGGSPLRSDWPRNDRFLKFAERKELQSRLTGAGFDTQGADGIIGPNTISAIRAFQRSRGMIPDGYASYEVLRRLR